MNAVLVALVATSLAEAAPAREAEPPNPGASSVAQYVELVPTASGPQAPGIGKERRLPLPPEAKRALDRVPKPMAAALLAVSTLSTYGAPSRLGNAASARDVFTTPAVTRSPPRSQSLEATAAAMAPRGDAHMIGLLVILAAVTVAAGALSLRRRL